MFKIALILIFSSFSYGALLNGTGAAIGKTLITVQDAYIYRSLQRAKDGEKPFVKTESGDELKRTIQKVAFEEMVILEMKSLEVEMPARVEVEKRITEIRKKGGEASWKELLARFNLSEAKALELLARSAEVEKFLQKKVETLTPVITEVELQKYFDDNQARFKGNSFAQMKPNIVVLLKKQKVQKGLEEWIRFLKEKYGFVTLLEG